MPNRKVIADGERIVLQVLVKHVIHVGNVVLGTFVVGEMSHDNTFQPGKDAAAEGMRAD